MTLCCCTTPSTTGWGHCSGGSSRRWTRARRRSRKTSTRTDPDGSRWPLAYPGSVLTIDEATYAAIVAHARADHPDEACGIVAGPEGSDRPERFVPMTNSERSPTFYRLDSDEQFKVWGEMDDRDEEPVIIYHSHTSTEAYPSRTDVSYASEPNAHYVLVSTRDT